MYMYMYTYCTYVLYMYMGSFGGMFVRRWYLFILPNVNKLHNIYFIRTTLWSLFYSCASVYVRLSHNPLVCLLSLDSQSVLMGVRAKTCQRGLLVRVYALTPMLCMYYSRYVPSCLSVLVYVATVSCTFISLILLRKCTFICLFLVGAIHIPLDVDGLSPVDCLHVVSAYSVCAHVCVCVCMCLYLQ